VQRISIAMNSLLGNNVSPRAKDLLEIKHNIGVLFLRRAQESALSATGWMGCRSVAVYRSVWCCLLIAHQLRLERRPPVSGGSRCCVRRLACLAGSVRSRNRCYQLNGSNGQRFQPHGACSARRLRPNFNSSSVPSNRRQWPAGRTCSAHIGTELSLMLNAI